MLGKTTKGTLKEKVSKEPKVQLTKEEKALQKAAKQAEKEASKKAKVPKEPKVKAAKAPKKSGKKLKPADILSAIKGFFLKIPGVSKLTAPKEALKAFGTAALFYQCGEDHTECRSCRRNCLSRISPEIYSSLSFRTSIRCW